MPDGDVQFVRNRGAHWTFLPATLPAMGLLGRVAAGRHRKLEEFLGGQLEGGESLEAMLPMTQTRNPASVAAFIVEFGFSADPPGYYGIGVSDRSVYLVSWRSSVPERPDEIMATIPRTEVTVSGWSPPRMLSGTLSLELRDKRLEVEVPKAHRGDADQLVAALGGVRSE